VHFDPLRTDVEAVIRDLEAAAERAAPLEDTARELTIPVCYGGAHGPDLEAVARFARCPAAAVIATHASCIYRVYMLGFVPGFAYMGSVDERIAMPRRDTPRLRVPMGSVGIAGRQTGIYPLEAPGGWRLIGRTPLRTFDAGRAAPFLFRAGDHVRFEPVDGAAFARLSTDC
jgi:inhibitor of KinA